MQLLAYPFRLIGGRAATVTDGTDAATADAVARMCLTRLGELELVPAYGTRDPVWAEPIADSDPTLSASIDVAQLNACLATFGPAATVALASVTRTDNTERVELEVSTA